MRCRECEEVIALDVSRNDGTYEHFDAWTERLADHKAEAERR